MAAAVNFRGDAVYSCITAALKKLTRRP